MHEHRRHSSARAQDDHRAYHVQIFEHEIGHGARYFAVTETATCTTDDPGSNFTAKESVPVKPRSGT